MLSKHLTTLSSTIAVFAAYTAAFDVNCNTNYASYYGQNSARNQKTLGEYCKDAVEDVIVLAFMNGFPNILLNFANACETTFEGSTLLHCPNMAKDIKYCQSQGKAVILSMGGASGAYGFSGDSDAVAFADTVWNMFFKGNSDKRPFDDAVLDGIDLDIEGGSGAGYPAFINQLRSHYASDPSKNYYIAAAPQCPFPDVYLSSTLNNAWFDMVYVQFYNNYCGLNAYPSWFNFEEWDNWVQTKSINKNVKVYIGAPGSPSAASSGYVDGKMLTSIFNDARSKYSSIGGIMTWDVSQARTSGLAGSIRAALNAGGTCIHQNNTETSSSEQSTTSESHNSSTNSETSSDHYTQEHTDEDSYDISLVVTTATQEITSVSTFVTTFLTEVTTETTYTSYLTSIYTLTQTASNHSVTSSVPFSTSEESETATVAPVEPSPGTNSTSCPTEGAQCKDGTQGCNEYGYALCVAGKWAIYPCFTGTTCYILGSSAICDWENSHTRDPCNVQPIQRQATNKQSWLSKLQSDIRPVSIFTSEGVSSHIEFTPLSVSRGQFTALLKMQTLRTPFNGNWSVQLHLPPGQSINRVDNATIVSNGTSIHHQAWLSL
ncbi:Chitinase 2 [Coemansia brasiliensis]|uniref:chitinase n=1 Tax=Coemansia brasiliensis TaxID=2650707 RepID=A0A9W8M0L6_9FUNG|nr:Chitinase 2 [Coemansia brasiliensis]